MRPHPPAATAGGARANLKERAAEAAVERVRDGMVLGLGTGSTTRYALQAVARRVEEGDALQGVPTSRATAELATSLGIPLTTLEEHPRLDLTIDGADEVDPRLDLIKGMGGALTREKLVALASDRVLIIVDESKRVEVLGTRTPVPVEVLPFGWQGTRARLESLGSTPALRRGADAPYLTDNGNFVLDARFPPIEDGEALATRIKALPGVVEHGLFLGIADAVLVGGSGGVEVLRRP